MNNRIEIAREFAKAIRSEKIIKIILFGSVAREEDTEDSDIDILIISNDWGLIDSLITDEVFKVVLDTGELISPYVLSEKQFNETRNFNFLTNVLKEGIVIGWKWCIHQKAKSKLTSSISLYEIGQYGDSVGRSYYAMFLSAKALLVRSGYDVNSHRSLIGIFGRDYVKNGDFDSNIAKYLSGTQSLRDHADYDAIDTISKEIAKERIRQAEKFIAEAERLL